MRKMRSMAAGFLAVVLTISSLTTAVPAAEAAAVPKATKSLSIKKGKTKTIKVTGSKIKSKKFKSSNTKIATVNKKGKVKGKKKGSCKINITVKYEANKKLATKKLVCKVKVNGAASNSSASKAPAATSASAGAVTTSGSAASQPNPFGNSKTVYVPFPDVTAKPVELKTAIPFVIPSSNTGLEKSEERTSEKVVESVAPYVEPEATDSAKEEEQFQEVKNPEKTYAPVTPTPAPTEEATATPMATPVIIYTSSDFDELKPALTAGYTATLETTKTKTITLAGEYEGKLIVNAPNATINNQATFKKGINIIAVASDTWKEQAAGNILRLKNNAPIHVILEKNAKIIITNASKGQSNIDITKDAVEVTVENANTDYYSSAIPQINLEAAANLSMIGDTSGNVFTYGHKAANIKALAANATIKTALPIEVNADAAVDIQFTESAVVNRSKFIAKDEADIKIEANDTSDATSADVYLKTVDENTQEESIETTASKSATVTEATTKITVADTVEEGEPSDLYSTDEISITYGISSVEVNDSSGLISNYDVQSNAISLYGSEEDSSKYTNLLNQLDFRVYVNRYVNGSLVDTYVLQSGSDGVSVQKPEESGDLIGRLLVNKSYDEDESYVRASYNIYLALPAAEPMEATYTFHQLTADTNDYVISASTIYDKDEAIVLTVDEAVDESEYA